MAQPKHVGNGKPHCQPEAPKLFKSSSMWVVVEPSADVSFCLCDLSVTLKSRWMTRQLPLSPHLHTRNDKTNCASMVMMSLAAKERKKTSK